MRESTLDEKRDSKLKVRMFPVKLNTADVEFGTPKPFELGAKSPRGLLTRRKTRNNTAMYNT
jgi:predicted DNA-binding helix-hairpin-helix protein